MSTKTIKIVKVEELEGFDAAEFCVKPSYYGFDFVSEHEISQDLLEEVKKTAFAVDGIAVAIIEDHLGSYVIGQTCNKGCSSKFLLFNAQATGREDAEVRAITYNTGRGALTRYWYDRWVKYCPGSVL